jgi:predicted metal-binding membrane protein
MTPVEKLLKRERLTVGGALALIVVLAWGYTLHLARTMNLSGGDMAMPQMHAWSAAMFAFMFLMWSVMMVAMMLPSAAPMILTFAAVQRRRQAQGGAYVPTAVFIAGYLLVWAAFSLLATGAQYALERAALVSPMMGKAAPWLGALLLIGAGLFQFAPLKDVCLAKCRSPLGFIMTDWRDGTRGALVMGLRHGAYCAGCCWALMALLFVGGVMNLLWVAALALFVLIEKVVPAGGRLGKAGGVLLIGWGGWIVWLTSRATA